MDLFDISTPEKPKLISHFDTSGEHSRGAHCLWFVDGEYIHLTSGATDFQPRNPKDHQIYRIIDVKNPSKPVEVGPLVVPGPEGRRRGAAAAAPSEVRRRLSPAQRHGLSRAARPRVHRLHRRRRVILDISDKSKPKEVSHFKYSPPMNGMTHTVMPLLKRELLVISDESNKDDAADWPKMTWIVNAEDETNLVPISTLPLPDVEVVRASAAGASARTTSTRTIPGPLSLALRPDRRRRVLQRRRARVRHLQPVPAAGDRLLRSGRAEDVAQRRDPDQRRLHRRPRASCSRRTVSAAGSTCWR